METSTSHVPSHFDLSEKEFNQLMALWRLYHRNANRCLDAKAYLAGCAAAGAAFETALIAMVHLKWRQIPPSFKLPRRKGQPKPLMDWTIDDLLKAAHEAGWLPRTCDFRQAFETHEPAAGDFASQLRQLRNLIHPRRYLRDHAGRRVTKRMLEYAIEVARELGARLGSIVEIDLAKQLNNSE